MTRPPMWLSHLRYNTPHVGQLRRGLAAAELPLYQRFGWEDEEFTSLSPTGSFPDGWRLYAEMLQRGYANLTLGPRTWIRFDHTGIFATELDAIVERAEAAGKDVRDRDGRPPFFMAPWRFRIVIHPDGDAERHALPQFTLGGNHFPNREVVDVHALADHRAVCMEGIDEHR